MATSISLAAGRCKKATPAMINRIRSDVIAFATFLIQTVYALAESPSPGTVIENLLRVTYIDGTLGPVDVILQDAPVLVVDAFPAMGVSSADIVIAAPDGAAALPARLDNIGNVDLNVVIAFMNQAGELEPLAVFEDSDGDGLLDPGEPLLSADGRLSLAAGGEQSVVLRYAQPATAPGSLDVPLDIIFADEATGLALSRTRIISFSAGGALRFTDAGFTTDRDQLATESDVFVEAQSPLCNADPGVAEQIDITIESAPDGDAETVSATETGPDTNVFRSAGLPIRRAAPRQPGDGILAAVKGQNIRASAVCAGAPFETTAPVNDGGFVFDALTNAPVDGATVILSEENGAEIDRATTGPDGFYRFVDLPAGRYRISVADPGGLVFPSQVETFDGFDRNTDPLASFGALFETGALAAFGPDIPLDPAGSLLIVADKTANRETARFGDFIRYEINIENRLNAALRNLSVTDTLPSGLAYQPGTAAFDGAPIADPQGAPGAALRFDLSALELGPLENGVLSYVARVLPTAGEGARVNSAVAEAVPAGFTTPVRSNTARHELDVDNTGTVFADDAVVLGKVWLDVNGNGVQDAYGWNDAVRIEALARRASTFDMHVRDMPGALICGARAADAPCRMDQDAMRMEPGVPGVRIYLQNGLSVVTDKDGFYSLPGLRAHTHVFAMDKASLPPGAKTAAASVRDALSPGSRFVNLRRGEVRVEDFPLKLEDARMLAALKTRIDDFQGLAVGDSLLRTELPLTREPVRPAVASRQSELATSTQARASPPAHDRSFRAAPPLQRFAPGGDLKSVLPQADGALAFLDLRNGDTLLRAQRSVRVIGPAAGELHLYVNGAAVDPGRIGERAVDRAAGVQAIEYVAVGFRPGANELALVQRDPFGNERGRTNLTVHAPGQPARLDVTVPAQSVADPTTPAPVAIRVVDAAGRRVATPIEASLEATGGYFDAADIREAEPGLQVYIDNGEAVFDYTPPALAGTQVITVRSPLGDYSAPLRLTPDLDQRLAVGVIEGALRFGENGASLAPLIEDDALSAFEDSVEGARGALYLKGRIRGDALLTLRYDSDRDTEDRVFRDIDPDDFYPVYGDNSERGFDAQSSGALFVKVEKGLSYVLYGDINIAPQARAFELGAFGRIATGAQAHWENQRVRIDLFAARSDETQIIREFRAGGVAGPYEVDLAGLIDGSERIEIAVYDRDQPSVQIGLTELRRLSDYTVDIFTNTIVFDRPIPSVDDDLNPQFIRITFEADEDAEDYWIAAGEISVRLTDAVTAGYREIRTTADGLSQDNRRLRSAYLAGDFGGLGRADAEVAESRNPAGETGRAVRIGYERNTEAARIRLRAGETGERFDAPNAAQAPGRREARLDVELRASARLTLLGEGLYTADKASGDERYGGAAHIRTRVSDQLETTAGVRYTATDRAGAEDDREVWSAIAGAHLRPKALPGASAKVEYERALRDGDISRWLVDGRYQIIEKAGVYGTFEIASSDAGEFGLGAFDNNRARSRIGIEVNWTDRVRSFSEHRMGAGGGLANGVEWRTEKENAHRFSASAEYVEPLAAEQERNAALSLGYAYEDAAQTTLFEFQPEWRRIGDVDHWNANLALGRRFGDVTLLLQNRLAIADNDGGGRTRDRLRLGAAYRPRGHSRFAGLASYELEYDDNDADNTRALIQSWSAGGQYRLADRVLLRARHAGRRNHQRFDGFDETSFILVNSLGAEFDITDRLHAGLDGIIYLDPNVNAAYAGAAAELGWAARENMLFTLGYAWAGVDEERIRDLERSGFYLRLRLKFDEDIWNVLDYAGLSGQ